MDKIELKLIRTMYNWKSLKQPVNLEKKNFKDVLYILFEKYVHDDSDMLDFIKYIDGEVDVSITHIDYDDMYNMIHENHDEYLAYIAEEAHQRWIDCTPNRVMASLNNMDAELFDIRMECKNETPCKEFVGDFERLGLEIDILKTKLWELMK